MIDLTIPDFLRSARRRSAPRPRRWSRMLPQRPEGEKWEHAERWEITVPVTWSDVGQSNLGIGSGRRRVWVVTGTKWAYIRDAEGHRKVPISEWERAANKGQRVT